MKLLVLTGIAEETDLESGSTRYLLVFNRGDLRIPVSEEAVRNVLNQTLTGPMEQAPRETSQETEEVSLPFDHGASQVPFQHENAFPVPKVPLKGDYSAPPSLDEGEEGAPQF